MSVLLASRHGGNLLLYTASDRLPDEGGARPWPKFVGLEEGSLNSTEDKEKFSLDERRRKENPKQAIFRIISSEDIMAKEEGKSKVFRV